MNNSTTIIDRISKINTSLSLEELEPNVVSSADEKPGWRQGDVYVVKSDYDISKLAPLTSKPVKAEYIVVEGKADRQNHVFTSADEGVKFYEGEFGKEFAFGMLVLPEGATAYLVHTAEHGSTGFHSEVGGGDTCWHVFGQIDHLGGMTRALD